MKPTQIDVDGKKMRVSIGSSFLCMVGLPSAGQLPTPVGAANRHRSGVGAPLVAQLARLTEKPL